MIFNIWSGSGDAGSKEVDCFHFKLSEPISSSVIMKIVSYEDSVGWSPLSHGVGA